MALNWTSPRADESKWFGQQWLDDFWRGIKSDDLQRPDPYLLWGILTQFDDASGTPTDDKAVGIIIELKGDFSAKQFAKSVENKNWIKIDKLYATPPQALKNARFLTALVKKEFFAEIRYDKSRLRLREKIERFELVSALAPSNFPKEEKQEFKHKHDALEKGVTGLNCVVGIIDDGIAFAHERFRNRDGKTTRIHAFWDQGTFSADTNTPLYGKEFTRQEIDKLISDQPDEESIYKNKNVKYDAVRRRFAHGTFVLDTAAGYDPSELPDDAPGIIAVQLQSPSRRTRDRATGWLNARTLDGLRYILDRAWKLNGAEKIPPVVVNLSYGLAAGPHDGSSMLEMAMDELIDLCRKGGNPFEIVIAAGNNNLRRSHVHLQLQDGEEKMFCWRALPDDPTPNFVEVWLSGLSSDGKDEQVFIDIVHPSKSLPPARVRIGETKLLKSGNDVLCMVTSSRKVATGGRSMFLLAVAPTKSWNEKRNVSVAGTWEIGVKNQTNEPIEVHAWIQRDETPFTFPLFGRQSRFVDKNYIPFDRIGLPRQTDPAVGNEIPAPDADSIVTVENHNEVYVMRENTLNSIATGEHTVVVGGYRRSDGMVAPYSSSGPKLSRKGLPKHTGGVIAVGVSDDSPFLHGILGAGVRSGSRVIVDGTSVAAPQIARRLATYIADGRLPVRPGLDGKAAIKSEATIQEGKDHGIKGNPVFKVQNFKRAPSPTRGGAGRVDPELVAVKRRPQDQANKPSHMQNTTARRPAVRR